MKKILAATIMSLFGLAPAVGSACEYESSAAVTPPERLASAPAPAATKAPTSTVVRAPVQKYMAKQVADKSKEPVPEAKIVVVSTN